MTTSATQELLSEISSGEKFSPRTLGYFEGRTIGIFHQIILRLLRVMERGEGFSRRKFAVRLGKKPEQITRWFSSPRNLTLGTISALFLGAGYEVKGIVVADVRSGRLHVFPEKLQSMQLVPPVPTATSSDADSYRANSGTPDRYYVQEVA